MRKKIITLQVIPILLLFSCVFFSGAQAFYWNQNKEEVFKLAKEQDKFILLFVGRPTCSVCNRTSGYLTNEEGILKPILDENYITWYSYRDDPKSQEEVKEYTDEIRQYATTLPLLSVINPDFPGKNVAFRNGSNSEAALQQFLTIDLLANSKLKWYENKEEVFSLAKNENKYILKLVGKGASPNSQKVITQLNESTLRKMLEKNFILWYSSDVSEANLDVQTLSVDIEGDESEEILKTLPYISIIYPDNPDDPDNPLLMEEWWGGAFDEALEEILKVYTVSNENIMPENRISLLGNVLFISNSMNNEQIRICTLTGQCVAAIYKNDFAVSIDVSDFPKGVLVIHSSTGWNVKVFKQ